MWSKSIFLKEDPVVPFARPIFPLKEHRIMAAVLPPADISTNKNTVHFITINKRLKRINSRNNPYSLITA